MRIAALLLLALLLHAAPPDLLHQSWPASWITHPTAPATDYTVLHFRKTITLPEKPAQFTVHVSADNRYRLFVNGRSVAQGPAQSDLRNWRYETLDLAPFLQPGPNLLAAVVWNGGLYRPMAQISHRTGFVLQGATDAEQIANTGTPGWKVVDDPAYQPVIYADNDKKLLYDYYVAGSMERVDGALYPWGWETPAYDDSAWLAPLRIDPAAPAGVESHQKWQLTPRPVPLQDERPQRFADTKIPITIPAKQHVKLLLNQGVLTTGYPTLELSGGKGAQIQVTYLEALYENGKSKGDRTKTEGKSILGVHDIFLPDGGAHRIFEPLWIRNWRFIELDITTAADPLTLDDYRSRLCVYPAPLKAVFESDREMLSRIWDAGWRTLSLGAQDVYVSDLYWERIQYVGDTKLHALAHLAMTGDDRLFRQALELIDASRAPFGLTQSRYPADLEQYTPLYSLVWVTMVHDYWMYRDDALFVRQFLPGITQVLGWFERRLNADGMLEPLFHLDFVDSNYGRQWQAIHTGPGSKSMTIHSLFFAWTLDQAAELYAHYGDTTAAARARALSARIKQAVRARCWNPQRRIFSDTPEKRFYSQQANVLAVLTNLVPASEQPALLQRVLDDNSILPCQLYFRFYLGRALNQSGMSGRYLDNLKPWEDMIRMGMTTFGEIEGNPRSECHPWSGTPNYEFLSTVAGIEPASPGFRTVRIAPAPGPLRHIHAIMPHPKGPIEVTLDRRGRSGLTGRITLPPGLTGVFVWNGKQTPIPPAGLTIRE